MHTTIDLEAIETARMADIGPGQSQSTQDELLSVGNHTKMDRPAWTDGADPCGGLRHDDRIEIAD